MPSKSAKQAKLMAAVANNPKFAKKVGVPQSVGREFANADKRNKDMPSKYDSTANKPGKAVKKGYARGGRTAADSAGRRNRGSMTTSSRNPFTAAKAGPLRPWRGKKGGEVHDKKVLRNLDDEVYRIADKERMGGAEGRDARDERGRINREKRYEKRQMNRMNTGGSVQTKKDKSDESLGSTKPRGWGKAARGWQGRYDSTKRQR
jgi:hypothetical protein